MEPKTVARQYPNYPVYRSPHSGPASVRGRSRFARCLRTHWWLPALTSSDDTLSSLTRELEQQEEQLKAAQDQLLADQRDTSPAMLQEQNNSATSYLTKLTLQQADLRIESQMIESMAAARSDNSDGTDPDPGGALKTSSLASARPADYLSARHRVEMLKRDRDEFARNLRPQHPKIQRLNDEIARAEELRGVFHK